MPQYHSRFDRINARKKEKKEEALARQETAKKRTPEERLAKLDRDLGKDLGAKREREKLTRMMSQPRTSKAEERRAEALDKK